MHLSKRVFRKRRKLSLEGPESIYKSLTKNLDIVIVMWFSAKRQRKSENQPPITLIATTGDIEITDLEPGCNVSSDTNPA